MESCLMYPSQRPSTACAGMKQEGKLHAPFCAESQQAVGVVPALASCQSLDVAFQVTVYSCAEEAINSFPETNKELLL